MADGTRAQVQRRREEAEAAEEGEANPAPNPEVVLPNNQDGDNPLVIPDREEDEARDEYAVRVMSGYHTDTPITIKAEPSIWPTAAFINIHEHPI